MGLLPYFGSVSGKQIRYSVALGIYCQNSNGKLADCLGSIWPSRQLIGACKSPYGSFDCTGALVQTLGHALVS